jgi:membrane associated rhomboid family serine protease
MRRLGATPFAFPEFSGAARRLVLLNLAAYFLLLVAQLAFPATASQVSSALAFRPSQFLGGWLWQPITYSLIHPSLLGTLFDLLSLWFLVSFLETGHGSSWVTGLYAASVLGTALAAAAIYIVSGTLGATLAEVPLYGCIGGIFGLLIAIGVLYADTEFLMFFVVGIKAKYLAAIYALIAFAMLFGDQRMYAFAELGGALAGLLYIRLLPRRGLSFTFSERWYGLRNRYYRWKRRRAARKFEVYMRKQGRTVRFDGHGRQIDEDHDDKKRWN